MLKLPVGWEVGQAQIEDSDAPTLGLTTGPCVFRCKSGVRHVIVNGAYGTGLTHSA